MTNKIHEFLNIFQNSETETEFYVIFGNYIRMYKGIILQCNPCFELFFDMQNTNTVFDT